MTFAEQLKAAVARCGLTQPAAAALIGIKPRSLWNWLHAMTVPHRYMQEGSLAQLAALHCKTDMRHPNMRMLVAEDSSATAAERDAALAKLDVLERSIADMSHPNMLMLVSDLETERTARKALEEALWRANRECCQIGHPHSDQHDHDAPCPVEARIVAALTLASKLP